MFESLGFESWSPSNAAFTVAMVLGCIFGVAGHLSRFCLRRTIVGEPVQRRSALAVWAMALVVAVIGSQALLALQLIDFSEHRFLSTEMPLAAVAVGGLFFGSGMVLTRGCVSRLAVLSGSGNLRAISVLLVFAVVAHATLKGVLSPIRTWLGQFQLSVEDINTLLNLPGPRWLVIVGLVLLLAYVVYRSNTPLVNLLLGAIIGLLIPVAWLATGFVLYDDFDPLPLESLSFTLPASQTLFWLIASTSITPGFGVGLVLGVLLGSGLSHLLKGEFKWQSFESPKQTGRYMSGAFLMGVGGVLAGGCSVGAGLSGVSSLGFSAIAALFFIVMGGLLVNAFVDRVK